jgi:hypothetical protein
LTFSRPSAWATRIPATFSCRSALTAETFSRASLYAREAIRRNAMVATSTTGRAQKASSASGRSITSSTIAMPQNVDSDTTKVINPVCRNEDSASTSVVILVMMRPAISRS